MRVTADTNFLISATQWDNSAARKLLIKLIQENAVIFITQEILDEFNRILQRDFDCSQEDAQEVVNEVMIFATLIEPLEKIDFIKTDPSDNKVLECAVDSHSDYIVTYDARHLLSLKEFRGIKLVKPEDLLALILS